MRSNNMAYDALGLAGRLEPLVQARTVKLILASTTCKGW